MAPVCGLLFAAVNAACVCTAIIYIDKRKSSVELYSSCLQFLCDTFKRTLLVCFVQGMLSPAEKSDESCNRIRNISFFYQVTIMDGPVFVLRNRTFSLFVHLQETVY